MYTCGHHEVTARFDSDGDLRLVEYSLDPRMQRRTSGYARLPGACVPSFARLLEDALPVDRLTEYALAPSIKLVRQDRQLRVEASPRLVVMLDPIARLLGADLRASTSLLACADAVWPQEDWAPVADQMRPNLAAVLHERRIVR